MKKLIILFFIGLGIKPVFSQTDTCYTDRMGEIVSVMDSLGRLWQSMELSTNETTWNNFKADIENEQGLDAFDNFDEDSSIFRNSYIDLADKMDSLYALLRFDVDPEGLFTERQIQEKITNALECYLANITETLLELIQATAINKLAPIEIGGTPGPCQDQVRNCIATARRHYSLAVNQCNNAVGAGSGGNPNPITGGIGYIICLGAAYSNLQDDKWDCLLAYGACMSQQ